MQDKHYPLVAGAWCTTSDKKSYHSSKFAIVYINTSKAVSKSHSRYDAVFRQSFTALNRSVRRATKPAHAFMTNSST